MAIGSSTRARRSRRSRSGRRASALIRRCGRPSWRNSVSRSATTRPPARTHEPAGPGELADVGDVDTDARAARAELVEPVGGDRHDHALLGLGEPDLPRLEAGILARHQVEIDVGADPLGHLADGRRQSAGTAVGDRRVQVLGADERVDQQLLDDRVADLDARAGDLARRGIHRRRRERRAADAVAPGAPTEHDDPVAGMRAVVDGPGRGDADAAGEDERVGGVRRVVQHGAGDGRQADLVAVVGDAVDDPGADPQRMQRSVGQLVDRQVGGTEAQHVGDERSAGGPCRARRGSRRRRRCWRRRTARRPTDGCGSRP